MNTKAFFPCWGRSNLILGTGSEAKYFLFKKSAAVKFFHQIVKKQHFGTKKKIITHLDGFV